MTVRHRQKEFNDSPLRPYAGTKRVMNCYFGNKCGIAIVSGMPEGTGKSDQVKHIWKTRTANTVQPPILSSFPLSW